jgi:hypothetical protein
MENIIGEIQRENLMVENIPMMVREYTRSLI